MKMSIKLLLGDVDLMAADMTRAAAFDSIRERNGLTADEVNDLLDVFEDAAIAAGRLTAECNDYESQIEGLEAQLNEEYIISEQRAARIDDCRHILLGLTGLLSGPVKKSQISDRLATALAALEP